MSIFNMPSGDASAQSTGVNQTQPTTAGFQPATVTPNNRPAIDTNNQSQHDSIENNAGNVEAVMRSIAMNMLSGDEGFTPPAGANSVGQQFSQPLHQGFQQQQQQQQTAQQQQSFRAPAGNTPASLTDPANADQSGRALAVVENFLRFNPASDPLDGLDLVAMQNKIAEGDLTALTGALTHASNNTMRNTLQSFMLMMPSLVETIKAQVMNDVKTASSESEHWSDFVAKYPEFKSLRAAIEPQLKTAIKRNPTQQASLIQQTVARMYSGMVTATGMQPANTARSRRDTGDSFNMAEFLGPKT